MRTISDLHEDSSGAVLLWVSLLILVIMGFTALAIDGSRYLNLNSNMQQIADSAALAGAKSLDGSANAIEQARIDAQSFLSNSPAWSDIASGSGPIATVEFSNTADFAKILADDEDRDASFIRVTTTSRGLKSTFASFLGIRESYTKAVAVAKVAYSVCRPVQSFLCNPYEGLQTSPADQGKAVAFVPPNVKEGDMFLLGNGSGASPGSWGYIDAAGGTTSALLSQYWAATSPSSCAPIQVGLNNPFPDTGADTGKKAVSGMNVRFDNPMSTLPSALNIRAPVVTDGFAISTTPGSASCDSSKAVNSNFKYKIGSGSSAVSYTCIFRQTDYASATPFADYRDYCNARDTGVGGGSGGTESCTALVPSSGAASLNRIGSCPLPRDRDLKTSGKSWDATSQGTGPTLADLQAYWFNHHTAAYPTDATTGQPVATRYKLYLEEIRNLGNSGYYDAPGPATAVEPTNPPNSSAACTASTVGDQSRRVINVAIVDCNYWKLSGKSTRLPNFTKNATFFMTEPATNTGGASEQGWIYAEFIRSFDVNEEGGSTFQSVELVR